MDYENQIQKCTNEKSFQNNVQLIQRVKKRLCEKQYQATLGIGSLFYAFIGFVFKISNYEMEDWNIPNYLFYSVLGYYLIYSFYIIDQYLVISSVYDEISKQNVVSFSITIELSPSEEYKKQDFNRNLLDKISFNNTRLHIIGFFLFICHLLYVILFLQNDTQAFIFLLIIFTGYYINIAVYIVVFLKNAFKYVRKTVIRRNSKVQELNCSTDEQCCICFEKFQKKDNIQQYSCCSNIFHSQCIEEWKSVKSSCPLCRSLI